MTINEYQKECVKTLPKFLTRGDETLLALLALNGAAGECADYYKEVLYMNREMTPEEFGKKLAAVIRCVAICADGMDLKLADILKKDMESVGDGD